MTPGQCRAARIVLGWSQADLADRTGLRVSWVSWFENGKGETPAGTEKRLVRAFKAAGIRFEGDWGVTYKERQRRRNARA